MLTMSRLKASNSSREILLGMDGTNNQGRCYREFHCRSQKVGIICLEHLR